MAIVARMVARHGVPSIEDYRRVYEQSGAPWPADEEIRRRHPVAPRRDRGKVVGPPDRKGPGPSIPLRSHPVITTGARAPDTD